MLRQLIKTARKSKRFARALPAPTRTFAAIVLTRLHAYYHERLYRRMVSPTGLADLEKHICTNALQLTAPVALISQIERSGGTLLSQLFDGHPQIAAYPHELRFGLNGHDIWPDSLKTFRDAADLKMQKQMKHGFRKGRHGEPLRFLISPRIQKQIFDGIEKRTARDSFDAFFTAFFNAWLDDQGDLNDKTLITAFAPRLALDADNVRRFFAAYPDGYLIQVMRDFDSWSRSALPFYAALGRTVTQDDLRRIWNANVESIERNQREYGDRVLPISFDDLRRDPAAVLAQLSKRLPIENHAASAQPTFNGRLAWANSSFEVERPGLLDGAGTAAAANRATPDANMVARTVSSSARNPSRRTRRPRAAP
jgi:Sulfotransferase family